MRVSVNDAGAVRTKQTKTSANQRNKTSKVHLSVRPDPIAL